MPSFFLRASLALKKTKQNEQTVKESRNIVSAMVDQCTQLSNQACHPTGHVMKIEVYLVDVLKTE